MGNDGIFLLCLAAYFIAIPSLIFGGDIFVRPRYPRIGIAMFWLGLAMIVVGMFGSLLVAAVNGR